MRHSALLSMIGTAAVVAPLAAQNAALGASATVLRPFPMERLLAESVHPKIRILPRPPGADWEVEITLQEVWPGDFILTIAPEGEFGGGIPGMGAGLSACREEPWHPGEDEPELDAPARVIRCRVPPMHTAAGKLFTLSHIAAAEI